MEGELSQIHDRAVFEPLDFAKLTWEEMKQALESHLFLEKKKDNEIKGRIVGGGNKQRQYTPKQEASSPTSHTEAVFSTAVIDAMEEGDVAIIDIPNAFCQTDPINT